MSCVRSPAISASKHPKAGRMTFEFTSFAVTDQVDMKLIVYTPLAADRTIEKLDALLTGRLRSKSRLVTGGGTERADQ